MLSFIMDFPDRKASFSSLLSSNFPSKDFAPALASVTRWNARSPTLIIARYDGPGLERVLEPPIDAAGVG